MSGDEKLNNTHWYEDHQSSYLLSHFKLGGTVFLLVPMEIWPPKTKVQPLKFGPPILSYKANS